MCDLPPTIYQFAVVDSHATHAANESKVRQVFLIGQSRLGVNLQGVVITAHKKLQSNTSHSLINLNALFFSLDFNGLSYAYMT